MVSSFALPLWGWNKKTKARTLLLALGAPPIFSEVFFLHADRKTGALEWVPLQHTELDTVSLERIDVSTDGLGNAKLAEVPTPLEAMKADAAALAAPPLA